MYGWREAALALQSAGMAITLSACFAHIRKQLFVSRGTRKAAYEALLKVHSEITNFPDCFALSTYLKTLWPKLFPAESDERAPIQQYEACLLLHRIMSGIFELNRQVRKGNAFVHAWCKVQYNDIEIRQKKLTEWDSFPLHGQCLRPNCEVNVTTPPLGSSGGLHSS
jgi:hypothetical protein